MIEVHAKFGCNDSSFSSSKKPGLALESELKLYKTLADFSEWFILQLSHLPAKSMFEDPSSLLTEISS